MVNQEKLPGLQIARAIAALLVAYGHSWHIILSFPPATAYPIPNIGMLPAVPLFFAISGYVICLIAAKPGFRLTQFLARRAIRIYPLWVVTTFAFLGLSLVALGLQPGTTPASFFYSLTLLPTNGYPFYNVGWSLQHEIAFYLLAAILVPHFGIAGLAAFLISAVALDRLFSLPWYLHLYAEYYPCFLAGIAAFALHARLRVAGFWIPIVTGTGILALLSPDLNGCAYSLMLFLLLTGLVNISKISSRVGRIGVLLGDASYSIYLIHPLIFGFIYARLQPPLPPIWSQEILRYGSIAIVCLLSIASWRYFESPIIRLGNRLTRVGDSTPGTQSKPATFPLHP
ncbi:MAG: acyltransferase 3 [Ramlibacter sp.]|nr:acyltransferase 3 [Ramlibacter sp.]